MEIIQHELQKGGGGERGQVSQWDGYWRPWAARPGSQPGEPGILKRQRENSSP